MKIVPPPPNSLKTNINDLEHLNNIYRNFNEEFINKHFPYFEWFKEVLPVKSVLHLGCGWGKETFALAWGLEAPRTIGLDKNPDVTQWAKEKAKFISDFRTRFPRILQSVSDPHHQNQLKTWWYEEMPNEIREGVLPKFPDALDFSLPIPDNYFEPDNYFDLVYCRYCLYQIAKEGQSSLFSACQNIRNVLRPETGRVVIVEPTKEGYVTYDFKGCLQDVGLILLKVQEKDSRLGRREIDNPKNREKGLANPEGYILKRGKTS